MAPMVDFSNCFEKDSGLKLKDIGAYRNNRDGLAIAYAGDYLHQHSKSDKKLLIVLSDGQPYAANYGGHQAIHDVKKQVQDLKEKGISTIGIFTGHESENQYFKLMYESCLFANNDSIFSLPKELKIKLVKEFEDYLKKF
jgi:nitric oxide reductase activation protein